MSGASRLVYGAARFAGITALRRRRLHAAPIFCFHGVVEDHLAGRAGDPGLHLGAGRFRELARFIAHAYRVVPLPELAARHARGASLRGLAAISFDDAYKGVFRHALPVLHALGAPCTLFVVAEAATRPAPFWWDALALAGRLDAPTREAALTRAEGATPRVLAEVGITAPPVPDDAFPAPWDTIRSALGDLVAVGNHTATHRNLTVLAPERVAAEVTGCAHALAEHLGRTSTLLAYPYGLTDARTLTAVRDAGVGAAVTMRYGLARAPAEPLLLPRVNVPHGIDALSLEAWAAGLRVRPPR